MSNDEQLPLEVRELIRERVQSIEALEVVLALHERRDRAVPVAELSATLRISLAAVTSAVEELSQADLVELSEKSARYRPPSTEVDRSVEALVDTYRNLRVETLVFIASNAIGRVRKSALRTFAEAFKLQGKKK